MTIKTGTGLANPRFHSHVAIDTGVTVTVTHEKVTLDPITDLHMLQYIMPQKLKHIPLLTRHPTQQILIMQKFFQRPQ